MTGIELIADERQRQITQEGWLASHDDQHTHSQIARAALSYARVAVAQVQTGTNFSPTREPSKWAWPWDEKWWKPTHDPIRNLVKAGALIAAEIDRIQRSKEAA